MDKVFGTNSIRDNRTSLAFVRYNFLGMTRTNSKKSGRLSRQTLHERLDHAVIELRERLGGLPSPVEAGEIWQDIWYHEAHNSTAIEGNTLVLKQVEVLLAEGRAVGNKDLREYMEVKGYADAAKWVYEQALEPAEWTDGALLTLTEVRQIHRTAMQPVWDVEPHPGATPEEGPGSFRQHEIAPFQGGMAPPSWPQVPAEMHDWLREVQKLRNPTWALVEAVADLHAHFERIHPFLDGNGRVGRLLTNLLLVRLGYPPAIIYKRDRKRYLAALRRADAGDAGLLGEIFARAVLDNLYRFIVPAVAGPAKLVPLTSLPTEGVNAEALRIAAIRGRLKAQKGADGQWRSTKRWVEEYISSRYKRSGTQFR
jgi:fido (protein-threonine AMPylation protein)